MHSETGTATAEFAVALPAILMVLTFCLGALMIPVERMALVSRAAELARAAARGEAVAAAKVQGNRICVTLEKQTLVTLSETMCARRLGL